MASTAFEEEADKDSTSPAEAVVFEITKFPPAAKGRSTSLLNTADPLAVKVWVTVKAPELVVVMPDPPIVIPEPAAAPKARVSALSSIKSQLSVASQILKSPVSVPSPTPLSKL